MVNITTSLQKLFLTLLVGSSLALLSSGDVQAITLDFEGFGVGQIIDNEYSSLGVTISAENLSTGPDLAVVFDSSNYTGGDSDLASPFSPGLNSTGLSDAHPGNILIIHEHSEDCGSLFCVDPDDEGDRPAGIFTIDFDTPIFLRSIDFFDIEEAENGRTEFNQILLYGDGGLITDNFYTPNTGNNRWDRIDFSIHDVIRAEIHLGGSGAIDNITFAVPEPSTLLLLGSGLVGMALFRRKLMA